MFMKDKPVKIFCKWLNDVDTVYACFRENDITNVIYQSFAVEKSSFGSLNSFELKPDGKDIPVTEENKKEYVQ